MIPGKKQVKGERACDLMASSIVVGKACCQEFEEAGHMSTVWKVKTAGSERRL